jgi:UDP-2,3-diacylglucosamine hydrolase
MPSGRYLFVSDLHLDASAPAAVAQFIEFLQQQASQCAGLYILGDLFETWIGDDDDEPVRASICNALRMLADSGVPCFIQRGNRDFLLGAGFEARTGAKLLPDPALLSLGTQRIVLSHGDLLCTADHRYQQFRSLVRGAGFQRALLRLPLSTRRAMTRHARATSRAHTRQMREEVMDVDQRAVEAMLRVAGCDLLIHGHTHRPFVHRFDLDGRKATRIVLGDWYDQGSCLTLEPAGRYDLLGLPRAGASSRSIESSSARV